MKIEDDDETWNILLVFTMSADLVLSTCTDSNYFDLDGAVAICKLSEFLCVFHQEHRESLW